MRTLAGKTKILLAAALALMLIVLTASMAFAASGTAVTGSITVTKKISGALSTEQTFRFKLQAKGNAPMPSNAANGTVYASLTTKTDADVSFGDIAYTNAGYYEYTVSEVAGTHAAIGYDKTVYEATVLVIWKDGKVNGILTVAAVWFIRQGDTEQTKNDGAVFTNTYTPQGVDVDPLVRKAITGDVPSTASTFTFRMTADKSSCPMPEGSVNGVKEITVTGAGETEFGTIHYTAADIYTYRITEISGSAPGYTYDKTVYTMTVTVRDDNGVLKAERVITRSDGTVAGELLFTNKYTSGGTAATPKPGISTPDRPKTGDDSNDALWWALLVISAAGVILAICRKLKQKR